MLRKITAIRPRGDHVEVEVVEVADGGCWAVRTIYLHGDDADPSGTTPALGDAAVATANVLTDSAPVVGP